MTELQQLPLGAALNSTPIDQQMPCHRKNPRNNGFSHRRALPASGN
jgi:hypothetical protein